MLILPFHLRLTTLSLRQSFILFILPCRPLVTCHANASCNPYANAKRAAIVPAVCRACMHACMLARLNWGKQMNIYRDSHSALVWSAKGRLAGPPCGPRKPTRAHHVHASSFMAHVESISSMKSVPVVAWVEGRGATRQGSKDYPPGQLNVCSVRHDKVASSHIVAPISGSRRWGSCFR